MPCETPSKASAPHNADSEVDAGTLLHLLATDRRRLFVSYLADRPDETVDVDEVVDAITEAEWPDPGPATHRERVPIDLHHVHLPKLADAEVIDFDPVAETVRYDGPEALGTLLEATNAIEEE